LRGDGEVPQTTTPADTRGVESVVVVERVAVSIAASCNRWDLSFIIFLLPA
jgi:hypothetical protein